MLSCFFGCVNLILHCGESGASRSRRLGRRLEAAPVHILRNPHADTIAICNILQRFLPLELVLIILDCEEYWQSTTSSRLSFEGFGFLRTWDGALVLQLYLSSEPIQEHPARIQKVVFEIESHADMVLEPEEQRSFACVCQLLSTSH